MDDLLVYLALALGDPAWDGDGVEAPPATTGGQHVSPYATHPAVQDLLPEAGVPARRPEDGSDQVSRVCRVCGQDKPVTDYYPSRPLFCKPCTTAAINEHIQRVNEESRAAADHHREPWSELEVEMLLAAVGEGMHVKDVAEMLGRTYLAVHGKLRVVRQLLAEGKPITVARYTVHTETTTKITVTRENVCPACHVVRPCFCD